MTAAAPSPRLLLALLDQAEPAAVHLSVAPGEFFDMDAPEFSGALRVRVARNPWCIGVLSLVAVEVFGPDGRLLASTRMRPTLHYLAACEARA